jgi:hypothetical protein
MAEAPLFMTASMSLRVPLPALATSALKPCLAIRLTASNSPSETAAKPASITSTPNSSRRCAMRSLFSGTRDTPGVCSPSRRVVSKKFMRLGKRLNKAIPHLKSLYGSASMNDIKIMVQEIHVGFARYDLLINFLIFSLIRLYLFSKHNHFSKEALR